MSDAQRTENEQRALVCEIRGRRVEKRDLTIGFRIAVKHLFEGRKGHGNGPCTRRVMTPEQLTNFAHSAFRMGLDVARARQRIEARKNE